MLTCGGCGTSSEIPQETAREQQRQRRRSPPGAYRKPVPKNLGRRLPRRSLPTTPAPARPERQPNDGVELPRWRDPSVPVTERVEDLLARLTLEEKVAQLYSVWLGAGASEQDIAPHQHDLVDEKLDWPELIRNGLGQLTRPSAPPPSTRRGRPDPGPRPSGDRRGQPVRHPGDRPRGVPDRAHGLERRPLPDPAGLGRHLRPRRWSSGWPADRRRDAAARHPPGTGAGAGRDP